MDFIWSLLRFVILLSGHNRSGQSHLKWLLAQLSGTYWVGEWRSIRRVYLNVSSFLTALRKDDNRLGAGQWS